MTTASISLQDLRRKIYVKAKAGFGWNRWSRSWLYTDLGLFSQYYVRNPATESAANR
jgi:hypothetical protein